MTGKLVVKRNLVWTPDASMKVAPGKQQIKDKARVIALVVQTEKFRKKGYLPVKQYSAQFSFERMRIEFHGRLNLAEQIYYLACIC